MQKGQKGSSFLFLVCAFQLLLNSGIYTGKKAVCGFCKGLLPYHRKKPIGAFLYKSKILKGQAARVGPCMRLFFPMRRRLSELALVCGACYPFSAQDKQLIILLTEPSAHRKQLGNRRLEANSTFPFLYAYLGFLNSGILKKVYFILAPKGKQLYQPSLSCWLMRLQKAHTALAVLQGTIMTVPRRGTMIVPLWGTMQMTISLFAQG